MSGSDSLHSRESAKYRKVANGTTVDESLFGSRRKPVVRKSNANRDTTSISSIELAEIKERLIYQSVNSGLSQIQQQNNDTAKESRALDRKKYIKALDAAAKDKFNESGRVLSECQAKKIRKVAQEKLDQNEDIVKLLNTFSQRAVAFSIRDKQIIDKAVKTKEEDDYEKRMDLAMELDRLKELKLRGDREAAKIRKRVEDRKVIEDQIEVRRQQRILQEEEREQENCQMLTMNKRFQAEDEMKAKIRKEQAKAAQLDVIRQNEESAELKKKQADIAKKEDEKIIRYQKQRDEKLRMRELEEVEERRAKEILQKKMLANQTKSIDKQAKLDELRARRAMEEKERLYRQKELREAQKRKSDMKILHDARKRQEDERQEKIKREISIKNEEYEAAIKLAADMAKREKDEEQANEMMKEDFRVALRKQIEDNETKKKAKEKEKREEGRKLRENREIELIKLGAIRDKMVADMKSKGVNGKYFDEMKSLDIDKFLMK